MMRGISKKKMIGAIALSVCVPFLSGLAPVLAQEENWAVTDFASDIELREDGVLEITETIAIDFGGLERHGIFRDIPYAYKADTGEIIYTKVEFAETEMDGAPVLAAVQKNESNVRLRIGDPDRVISGAHTYTVRYTVRGALRGFEGYDEIYWNVTGNDWVVPIEKSSARVRLPRAGVVQSICYAGPVGSTAQCSEKGVRADEVMFTHTGRLEYGEGLTVAVGYEKGMAPLLAVSEYEAKNIDPRGIPVMIASLLATFAVGAYAIARNWWAKGRDKWFGNKAVHEPGAREETMPLGAHETIVAEYDPPDGLRPAELGVIKDETADTLDVSATIVDLAVRGYLKITEVPKSWMFGKTDYELTRLKEKDDTLLEYERELLHALFLEGGGTGVVRLSELKNKFYTKLDGIKKLVYSDVTEKGFFTADPLSVKTTYALIALALVAVGVGGSFAFGAFSFAYGTLAQAAASGISFGIAFSGIALLAVGQAAMPQRSAKGRELYRKIRGYELYLKNVEQYRQQFFERENTFFDVLPYVIVFGLTKKLSSAMAAMGMTPPAAPAWYVGAHPGTFSMDAFASSVDSFSKSLSTAIASSPSGSGSGGGGSSGGGFGGGGGGSW